MRYGQKWPIIKTAIFGEVHLDLELWSKNEIEKVRRTCIFDFKDAVHAAGTTIAEALPVDEIRAGPDISLGVYRQEFT